MKDFDQERAERHKAREEALGDRTIKIGGEIFVYKANVSVDVLRRLTSEETLTGADYIDSIEASCIDFLEGDDEDAKRFSLLLKRKEDPITMEDLQAVFSGLVQEAFKRPTQASSPSGASDADTGTSSTATSSIAPVAASAA